ncbi:hypothetical protein ABTY96_43835 [Streptomyces sp. NPDC096057]|uniref:hypothetical protein n=1 Tax=Streptomyces sp. NPDC096057 TaxID=3155543 RepID=UPI003319EF61
MALLLTAARPTGPRAAPGLCWGSGGHPPGRHSMEKLVELGAKVELPGKALG